MFSIEAPSGSPPQPGGTRTLLQEPGAGPQMIKSPPTQAVAPAQAVTPAQAAEKGQHAKANADAVKELVERLNQSLQDESGPVNTNVRFQLDMQTEELVVTVIDRRTEETIRQIPAEDVMKRMEVLGDFRGLLFNGEG